MLWRSAQPSSKTWNFQSKKLPSELTPTRRLHFVDFHWKQRIAIGRIFSWSGGPWKKAYKNIYKTEPMLLRKKYKQSATAHQKFLDTQVDLFKRPSPFDQMLIRPNVPAPLLCSKLERIGTIFSFREKAIPREFFCWLIIIIVRHLSKVELRSFQDR